VEEEGCDCRPWLSSRQEQTGGLLMLVVGPTTMWVC
jgi:hypothetical protein